VNLAVCPDLRFTPLLEKGQSDRGDGRRRAGYPGELTFPALM
jgi:hypothetical protein